METTLVPYQLLEELQSSGLGEGAAQVAALSDAALVTRYCRRGRHDHTRNRRRQFRDSIEPKDDLKLLAKPFTRAEILGRVRALLDEQS